jgi:hypothetical protein
LISGNYFISVNTTNDYLPKNTVSNKDVIEPQQAGCIAVTSGLKSIFRGYTV